MLKPNILPGHCVSINQIKGIAFMGFDEIEGIINDQLQSGVMSQVSPSYILIFLVRFDGDQCRRIVHSSEKPCCTKPSPCAKLKNRSLRF